MNGVVGTPRGPERRDPVSPLLGLGGALAQAGRDRLSGRLEVRDQGRSHEVLLTDGAIRGVALDGGQWTFGVGDLESRATALFGLTRPHAVWLPGGAPAETTRRLTPATVVLGGVMRRADLFEPAHLAERIPALQLSAEGRRLGELLRTVRFSPAERRFLESLERPTPVAMLLWRRGLEPRHAGALLVALNLVGVFDELWPPGLLPRIGAATRVSRLLRAGAPDHRLLGVAAGAPPEAVDRAFTDLCLELHPDRLSGVPATEVALAVEAFRGVVAARDRLRRASRRSRPFRGHGGTPVARVAVIGREPRGGWEELTREARACLARGRNTRAAAFALKALAQGPPEPVRVELAAIVSAARAA